MTRLRRLAASFWLAIRRVRSDLAITIGVVLAMAALIGVWVGIPLYAESASSRLLSIEVEDASADGVPFGYLFSYNRLSGGNKGWTDYSPLNEFVDGAETPFGPNVRTSRRVFTSARFDLVANDAGGPTVIDTLSFASMSSFADTASLSAGRFAQPATDPAEVIEVVVDEDTAEQQGLDVGQRLTVINRRAELDDTNRSVEIAITGIWSPPETSATSTPRPEARFLRNGVLLGNLVVPETTMASVVDSLGDEMFTNAQWLVLLDSAAVTTDSVNSLLADTDRINRQVNERLGGARLLVSPENSLVGFQEDVASLNRGLSLFSLPALALVLAVLSLLVSMRWSRRLSEVVLLRRRGVPTSQILTESALETVVLAVLAAALGLLGARLVATFIGRTETFLRVGEGVDLELVMNSRSWRALIVATLVAAALVFSPSIAARRDRLLSVGTPTSDVSSAPWWKRSYLDIALVVTIAFFTWFLLRRDALRGDLLEDPIVILLPAINALAVGLVALRLIPKAMTALARLLERTDSTALLLVARRSARMASAMSAPVLLLIITAALAVYTGSLARTLDLQLLDAAYHEVGASNSVITPDDIETIRLEVVDGASVPSPAVQQAPDASSFDRAWGMAATSRVAQLPARLEAPGKQTEPVSFIAVDPSTFGDLAFWRDDYAARTLPDLLARLEATPDALLVNAELLRESELRLGDVVRVSIRTGGQNIVVDMVIVGSFSQFPTWSPSDEFTPVVGSLADLEGRSGRRLADQLLFNTEPNVSDLAQTRADMSRLGIDAAVPRSPNQLVEREQQRPERQGIFGLLTVSFVLSAVLSVAGFVFYALFGFTRQLTDLGVLRALGLPGRSLRRLVVFDLLLVAALGVLIGAGAGLAMAAWYLPRLIDNPVGDAPALLQEIDWSAALGIPLALAAVLIVITLGLLVVLRRIKLFEAIKLGADS